MPDWPQNPPRLASPSSARQLGVAQESAGSWLPRLRALSALLPEAIDEIQRARVIDAMVTAVAEYGYAGATFERIFRLGHTTSKTFYQFFTGREDCLLGSYRHFATELQSELTTPWQAEKRWPRQICAALRAGLAFAAERPDVARLLAVEAETAGPAARALHHESLARLAAKLREGREGYPAAAGLSPVADRVIVGGLVSLIGNRVLAGQAEFLPALGPELVELVLAFYLDPAAAHKLAAS